MEKKNKNYIKMTAIVAIVANLSITIIELLVLFRILPYELIGGGRMGSYEKAAVLAVFSILIQVVLVYCTAVLFVWCRSFAFPLLFTGERAKNSVKFVTTDKVSI